MEVRIAVLADYASMSQGNKLNILGIFSNINTENVPAVHSNMKLITSFEFESTEAGTKNFTIELVNEDGREIFSLNGQLHFEGNPDGHSTVVNQILDLNNVIFPEFGDYEFTVSFDGETASRIPVSVTMPSPSSPGS